MHYDLIHLFVQQNATAGGLTAKWIVYVEEFQSSILIPSRNTLAKLFFLINIERKTVFVLTFLFHIFFNKC